jgi:uncharacterized Ntn-hydrolase superfamily protein
MALLARGWRPDEIVGALSARDGGSGYRQLILIDPTGRTAGWTGEANADAKSHWCEQDLAIAGNCLKSLSVLEAMRTAFADGAGRPLAERLLLAMEAGAREGGDRRGTKSAALLVDSGGPIPLDLRVDYDDQPVTALRALYARSLEPDYVTFMERLPTRDAPHRR